MANKYRKPRRVRQKHSFTKTMLKSRLVWIGMGVVFLLGLIGYGLFFSGVFRVEQVEVRGNNKVEEQQVREVAHEALGRQVLFWKLNNILLLDAQAVKYELKTQFAEIEEVEVDRTLLHTVDIKIKERRGVAIWCAEQECFAVDGKGVAFEARERSDFLPAFELGWQLEARVGQQVLSEEQLKKFLTLYEEVQDALAVHTSQVDVVTSYFHSEDRVHMRMSEGWEAYVSPLEDVDWQAAKLSSVLAKQVTPEHRPALQYIDLRFGDQAFIKYR